MNNSDTGFYEQMDNPGIANLSQPFQDLILQVAGKAMDLTETLDVFGYLEGDRALYWDQEDELYEPVHHFVNDLLNVEANKCFDEILELEPWLLDLTDYCSFEVSDEENAYHNYRQIADAKIEELVTEYLVEVNAS